MNNTCTDCKDDTGGNLVVHHIQNFKTFPELRIDVDNGITLCSKCHNLFHSLFGNKENNLGQINWFFENEIILKNSKLIKE